MFLLDPFLHKTKNIPKNLASLAAKAVFMSQVYLFLPLKHSIWDQKSIF
jgi:hypothetical protein